MSKNRDPLEARPFRWLRRSTDFYRSGAFLKRSPFLWHQGPPVQYNKRDLRALSDANAIPKTFKNITISWFSNRSLYYWSKLVARVRNLIFLNFKSNRYSWSWSLCSIGWSSCIRWHGQFPNGQLRCKINKYFCIKYTCK